MVIQSPGKFIFNRNKMLVNNVKLNQSEYTPKHNEDQLHHFG